MGIFFDAAVEPDDLTTFVRNIPTPGDNALLNLFPVEFEDDNQVDFAEIVRTNRTARYRAFDGRVHVSQRDVGSEKRVKLLPLSSSLSMGELERLQLEFARTGGTRTAALANAAYNDTEQLTREVRNRLDMAWGDVLTDGKLTINENGYQGEADFGVPGSHIVAPAGALWSNVTTSVPLTDLRAWADIYEGTNGVVPGQFLTSRAVMRLLTRNKEIIDAVYGSTQGRTMVSPAELNALLASEGLPVMAPVVESKYSVDGVDTRVLADDKVIILPDDIGQLGATKIGVTATALELVNSNQSDLSWADAPGIVGVIIKEEGVPFRQYAYVDCVGMPVLKDAKRLMIADVK